VFQDTQTLLNSLKEYKSPKAKLSQMIEKGSICHLKRGLYETNINSPSCAMAGAIYGPSYLSFEYALRRWELITDRICVYTSASYEKNKTKTFENQMGTYIYKSIPKEAYPYAITSITEKEYTYQIATPEKALCDTLYKAPPLKTVWELNKYLEDEYRVDMEKLYKLNMQDIRFLAPLYKRHNLILLIKLIENHK